MTSRDDVREIQRRANECAGDETELDRVREPTRLTRREVPFTRERGHHRRATEPQRHAEQFRERKQHQSTPLIRCAHARSNNNISASSSARMRKLDSPITTTPSP